MKLASYVYQGRASYGVVREDGVVDVPSQWQAGAATLLEAMQAGESAMSEIARLAKSSARAVPLDKVKLLAPLPQPPKLIGLAVNYVEHHNEFDRGHALPDDPKFHTTPRPFLMPSTCVIGPGDEIPWPSYSRQIDYEVELAVVIGGRAKCVSPQEAGRHISGYTIANDVSARSCTFAQGRQKRPRDDFFDWLHGKWADGFCPLGPWIVTADEIGDPMKLELSLAVNGEVRQKARTSAMIFDVFELVSFISHIMTLVPGDVIATGTPSGVGLATGNFLKGGDAISCRIEKIGELSNRLSMPPEAFYSPCEAGGTTMNK
jgi:2-keto-4-pentenoate hydratase/2-oxohepta-3-ene-1,7-dioic acid hydratase in catechol pathway